MKFIVGDVTDMKQFDNNSFDILIDKSTIDALLCGDNSFLMTAKMLKEAQRVLRVGGKYLAISYGNPDSREFHFYREFLSFDVKTFSLVDTDVSEAEKEEKSHYIYACVKLEDADQVCEKYYAAGIERLEIEAEAERKYALEHGLDETGIGEENETQKETKTKIKQK